MKIKYKFTSELVHWPGGEWRFAYLGGENAARIRVDFKGKFRGFTSLRIQANIGESTWKTSMFYSAKDASFLIPIKAAIRKAEGLHDGDKVDISIEILAE